jgi:hydroxymethylpyrimidine/phosphomethylpyrimidine kinase
LDTAARIPVAMTIAGSDPSGGAGLQADLKTFAALKVYGLSVITAVIAQSSASVSRVQAVEPDMVLAQLETMLAERMPDGLKIGALASAAIVKVVVKSVESLGLPAPVLDPVLVSSSGTRLLEPAAERILRTELLPLAAVVTPNIPEAEVLTGIKIDGASAIRQAAQTLHKLGARTVLVKGGHRPAIRGDTHRLKVADLFFDGHRYIEFASARVGGEGAHGTGCALSAAIAAWLARGTDLETAIARAKRFVTRALKHAFVLGNGRYLLDHFAH